MSDDATARRRFVKLAMSAPYLERDEEHELAKDWAYRQDDIALHKLTSAHMRLVISLASRFRHFGLSMSDLIQEGHIGLLEAARRFDPEREVRFSTYATWWIRAAMQDYILRNWSIVRGGTSSTQKALFFNLRRLRARLAQTSERTPSETHAEIATALKVSASDVALMDSRLSAPDTSLNAPVKDEDGSSASERQNFLVDSAPLPDENAGHTIDTERRKAWLREALTVLNPRELKIVSERRLSEDGVTLEHLGRRLGISKERVRQIECRAMEKLRDALETTQINGVGEQRPS